MLMLEEGMEVKEMVVVEDGSADECPRDDGIGYQSGGESTARCSHTSGDCGHKQSLPSQAAVMRIHLGKLGPVVPE